ncbi:MANSC domain-containing protein 1 isoform X4 [Numida meleagris]|uniref:MANSC domain-containing protein 1 isoform X4 n=1 Tax=Numida meleagris TaxID=8996 RepID=UPI000B3E3CEF|nr:MANSC domain-containing protein 1 isoform X4 [Numida meleagris]
MEVRGLPLCLLAVTCAVPALSLGQGCAAQRMDNAIIDINLSLPMGIRGVEPVHISTPEACIHACCLGKKLSGDKKCNFVIFDAQRASTQPNCYLFHCPSTEACLMKRAMGLVSYKIGQGFALSSIASPIASQNNHQDYDPSDSEGNLSENVQTRKGFVQLEDKSRLVAALLFGVIFLLLVIALMGKKMHESLQKRQYTSLSGDRALAQVVESPPWRSSEDACT